MGRRAARRVLSGATLALLGAATVAIGPAPARAQSVDQITVTGIDLAEPVEVRVDERPELCAALHREVNWLASRGDEAPEPEDVDALGPQYTLVVYVDGDRRDRFHLYPLAEGGPRVFRPAEQPDGRSVDEGWFYGRLSMPETLSAAGVPLTGVPPAGGGTGGGQPPAPGETPEPERDALAFLEEWREGVLLSVAVVVTIAIGLAGAAYLIRRKV